MVTESLLGWMFVAFGVLFLLPLTIALIRRGRYKGEREPRSNPSVVGSWREDGTDSPENQRVHSDEEIPPVRKIS